MIAEFCDITNTGLVVNLDISNNRFVELIEQDYLKSEL
jgi:hypothetical protein